MSAGSSNVKRSSRLAAKEQIRDIPEGENPDSRKRGRDRGDEYASTYKRPVPSLPKKPTIPASTADPTNTSSPVRDRLTSKPTVSSPNSNNAGGKEEQANYSPAAVVEGAAVFRVGHNATIASSATAEFDASQQASNTPAQRPPGNAPNAKAKQALRGIHSLTSQAKHLPPKTTPPIQAAVGKGLTSNQQIPVYKSARLAMGRPSTADINREGSPSLRIGQPNLPNSISSKPDQTFPGSELKPLNDGTVPPPLCAPREREKPARDRQRPSHDSATNSIAVPAAVNEKLRRSLGGAVERWISARSALPGGDEDDLGVFRPEIERLVKLIAFEAHESKYEIDEDVGSSGQDAQVEQPCSREITKTRFRLAHPEIKVPFVFESTQHIFSGSVLGAGEMGHRLEGLQWKVEFELIGFFVLAFHTQSFQVDEDVEIARLDEVLSRRPPPVLTVLSRVSDHYYAPPTEFRSPSLNNSQPCSLAACCPSFGKPDVRSGQSGLHSDVRSRRLRLSEGRSMLSFFTRSMLSSSHLSRLLHTSLCKPDFLLRTLDHHTRCGDSRLSRLLRPVALVRGGNAHNVQRVDRSRPV